MSVLPDESARLREDATLPLLDVHGTELHRAGGVEEPAVACFQDGEAGPPQCRVEAEGPRISSLPGPFIRPRTTPGQEDVRTGPPPGGSAE
jgi:hypothetical protein